MANIIGDPQKVAEGGNTSMDTLALINTSPIAGKEPVRPKWMETSFERKISTVPL